MQCIRQWGRTAGRQSTIQSVLNLEWDGERTSIIKITGFSSKDTLYGSLLNTKFSQTFTQCISKTFDTDDYHHLFLAISRGMLQRRKVRNHCSVTDSKRRAALKIHFMCCIIYAQNKHKFRGSVTFFTQDMCSCHADMTHWECWTLHGKLLKSSRLLMWIWNLHHFLNFSFPADGKHISQRAQLWIICSAQ